MWLFEDLVNVPLPKVDSAWTWVAITFISAFISLMVYVFKVMIPEKEKRIDNLINNYREDVKAMNIECRSERAEINADFKATLLQIQKISSDSLEAFQREINAELSHFRTKP